MTTCSTNRAAADFPDIESVSEWNSRASIFDRPKRHLLDIQRSRRYYFRIRFLRIHYTGSSFPFSLPPLSNSSRCFLKNSNFPAARETADGSSVSRSRSSIDFRCWLIDIGSRRSRQVDRPNGVSNFVHFESHAVIYMKMRDWFIGYFIPGNSLARVLSVCFRFYCLTYRFQAFSCLCVCVYVCVCVCGTHVTYI